MNIDIRTYDLEQGGGWDAGGAMLVETPNGDWVRTENYQCVIAALTARISALEAENKTLREALEICWFDDPDKTPIAEWMDDIFAEANANIRERAALAQKEASNG